MSCTDNTDKFATGTYLPGIYAVQHSFETTSIKMLYQFLKNSFQVFTFNF